MFNNCYTYPTKYKKKILYDNNIQVDAIVFHGPEINKGDIDWLKSQRNELKKSNKEHDPYYVLYCSAVCVSPSSHMFCTAVFCNVREANYTGKRMKRVGAQDLQYLDSTPLVF